MTAYGIDLGTTFTSVATVVDTGGIPRTQVVNITDMDKDTMESVVFIEPRGDKLVATVGAEARQSLQNALGDVEPEEGRRLQDDQFFVASKREIGLQREASREWPRDIGGRGFLPEHIASLILRKVKQEVSSTQPVPVEKVVITHPYYFTEPQKAATREAGRLAKLDVIDTLNEPTAAALAYGVLDRGAEGKYLVFDLGGGTLDVTLMTFSQGRIQVVRGDGNARLGGHDWDRALVKFFAQQFQQKFPEFDLDGPDVSPLTKFEWRRQAIETKIKLAKDTVHRVTLKAVFNDGSHGSHRLDLSREQIEGLTSDLARKCRNIADGVMNGADGGEPVQWSELKEVLMVGGSTRLPAIRQMIREALGRDPKTDGFDPNTLVAQGAAYYAMRADHDSRITNAVVRDPVQAPTTKTPRADLTLPKLHDATARGIGLGVDRDGVYVVDTLIPKSTTTPHRCVRTYYTLHPNQREIHATLYEGESEDPGSCAKMGECVLRDLPPGAGGQPVEVTFDISSSGRTTVFVKHLQSGRQLEQVIQRGSAARSTDGDALTWLWSDVDVT